MTCSVLLQCSCFQGITLIITLIYLLPEEKSNFKPNYYLKHSTDLIDKIKDIDVPSATKLI